MGYSEEKIKELIKSCSKDEDSASKLMELYAEILEKYNTKRKYLDLLERAVKNDYDSILITELNLEKPGPKIVYVNSGFTKMTGYSREEVIGKTPRILQGEKTDRNILDRLKKRLIEGQAFFGHTVNYKKDGSEFVNQWDIHPLTNADGEITHWVSYQRDITERQESSKILFDANVDFDKLEEESKRTFIDIDVQGNILSANKSFRDTLGIDIDELKKIKIWDLVTSADKEEVKNLFEDFDSSLEYDDVYAWEFEKENGDKLKLEASVKWFVSSDETIIRIHFENISLRDRVIETLKLKTDSLESLLETHEEFTLKFKRDDDGEIFCSYVSESFRSVTGRSEDELLEKGIKEVIADDSLEVLNKGLKKAFNGTLCSEKCSYKGKDGDIITVIQSFKPIYDSDEQVKAVKSVALLELKV